MLSGMVSFIFGLTLKLAFAVAAMAPAFALMTTGALPPGAVGVAVSATLRRSFAVAGVVLSVTLAGVNVPVVPVGSPLTESSASPL